MARHLQNSLSGKYGLNTTRITHDLVGGFLSYHHRGRLLVKDNSAIPELIILRKECASGEGINTLDVELLL